MTTAKITAMSPSEIHERLSNAASAVQMHKDAINHGVRFGRYLEILNPSDKNDGLDAFQRQLKEANIVVESDRYAGYWASDGKAFTDTEAGRALFGEFYARNWQHVMNANRAQHDEIQQRAILLSSDSTIGSWDRPYRDATGPRWRNRIAPPIPLSELIAVTTPITGEDYRSIYMTYDAAAVRMFRVGESANIPMTTLVSSQNTIRLRKYGRGLRASYEEMRRMKVDKLAWFIQWTALQAQIDKVAAIATVLVNGDGNANTGATEHNLLTLDPSASVDELSLLGWLSFRMQFSEAYTMTHALAKLPTAIQILTLNTGNANVPLANYPLGGMGTGVTVINHTGDNVRLGITSEAPTDKIIGFDASMAIEHITEIGSTISETERFIENQTQVITFTEVEAFCILDPAAVRILDLNE